MASFKAQIEDLIGAVGDDDLISQSIVDIGTEVINITPLPKLLSVADESDVSASGSTIDAKKILEVHKSSYIAKRVSHSDLAKYKDAGSIHYAGSSDPIYYTKDEKVFIVVSGSEVTGKLVYVPKQPTGDGTNLITHASTATQFFPREAEHLLVLGGSARCLQRLLSDKTSALPADITTDLVIPAAPVAPTLSSNSVTFGTTAPVYTAPVVAGETEELTAALSNDASADNNKLDFSDWFEVVGDYIQTEEDVELANSQLQKISTYIQAYSQAMQNQLHVFNDANVEYQAELQKAIQNAQLSSQDDAQEIQKYQGQVQDYSAQVSKAVQERSAELQNYSAKIQKQVTDYQWKASQLQQLKAEYQEALQMFINGGLPQMAQQ